MHLLLFRKYNEYRRCYMNNFVIMALIATLGTWFVTALGAATVVLFKSTNKKMLNIMLGFASGVMIAASFWSLLQPAIERAESILKTPAYFVVTVGFLFGATFMWVSDKTVTFARNKANNPKSQPNEKLQRIIMLILSITLHNIPEGLAVGVAFGALQNNFSTENLLGAVSVAVGIGLQNFPEGAAIALPMKVATRSKHKSFLFGMGSGAVEPIAAIAGYILASEVAVMQPWMLGFAAGAMIFVVAEDLIPDSNLSEYPHAGTWGVMFGFVLMMILDVALR